MKTVAFDTEGTGLTPHHGCLPFMIQACDGEYNHWWCGKVNPYNRFDVEWKVTELEKFLDFFYDCDKVVFHNTKYDVRMIYLILKKYNLHKGFLNFCFKHFEDTILAGHALCSGDSQSLKHLAKKYFDYYDDNEKLLSAAVQQARNTAPSNYDLAKKGHSAFGGINKGQWYKSDYWLVMDETLTYGLSDVEMTLMFWEMAQDAILKEGLTEPYNTRKKLLEVLYYLEDTGINLYHELIESDLEERAIKCEELRSKIEKENHYQHTLDLTQDDHLKFLIHEKLKIPVTYFTPTGQPSIRQEAINHYTATYPEIESIRDLQLYRKTATEISDIKSFERWKCADGKLHPNYWVTGTRNTRQSVQDPPAQCIGKTIRHLMGPPPGKVHLDFDLVNIEMRRWAYYVNNKELCKVFDEGGSVHLLIAETLYPKEYADVGAEFKTVYKNTLYQWVKNGNFSALYGAGERKADATYRMKGAYRKIAERFPETVAFTKKCENEALYNYETYYQPYVTVDGGYRLEVPLSEAYKAINYKVSGSAGWIMTEAMIAVYENPVYQESSCAMVSQVHDSLVIELDEQDLTVSLINSIKDSIESSGFKYMPTSVSEYDIVTHHTKPNLTVKDNQITEA